MYDINKKIDELAACKPARSKKRRRSLSLHQEVLSLVELANSHAPQERHVVPRAALTVMDRALKTLSLLDESSRRIGVIREVSKFISLQQDTNKGHFESTTYGDLLPVGHPLSTLNSFHTADEVRSNYAAWLSADPVVPSNVKSLVSSAFASKPFSVERKHAFTRLSLSKDANIPVFFKLDPIVAAFSFSGGNSSAARRARVALQLRDRLGRWVEMGRGLDFQVRLPNGNIETIKGTYVGVDESRGYTGNTRAIGGEVGIAAHVQVKGDSNLPDGIYSVESGNLDTVLARLTPEQLRKAGIKSKPKYRVVENYERNVPSIDDVLDTRTDAPTGWTSTDGNSFLSDDNYIVRSSKGELTLYRQDENGNLGDKVGSGATWADVNKLAAADEKSYDEFKDQVESGQLPIGDKPAPRREVNADDKYRIDAMRKKAEDRAQDVKDYDEVIKLAQSGKDSQGRDIPEGWTAEVVVGMSPTINYKRDIPGATRSNEYFIASVQNDGRIMFGSGSHWSELEPDNWDAVEANLPKELDVINRGRASIGLNPIEPEQDMLDDAKAAQRRLDGIEPSDDLDKAKITDEEKGLIPEGVNESGTLENGVTYKVEEVKTRVEVFPGRYTDTDAVKVTLDGNTYENRQRIKQLGFKWNNADKVWIKNYVNSDLFGKWNNTNRIKEELDGVGGNKMPRYKGDNNEDIATIQEAHNRMFAFANDNGIQNKDVPADMREQMKKLMAAQKDLQESNDGDRELAREKLNDFISNVDSIDLENTEQRDNAKAYAQKAVDSLSEKIGDSDMPESDKEVKNIVDDLDKATEVPIKTISKKSDSVPELFEGFDSPDGAFRFRTVEYEPEGRIDQESTDYTDSPDRLATRFPLPILVRALTEALIGKKDDDVLDQIVDSNLGDDDESLDLEQLNDVVDTPAPRAGRANASGAGALEFNAGDEFVPAEALYNAVYRAGGDPNRVIANAYDAVYGDRRNLEKLTSESGELPSPEEQQLIDDMMQEIRQIDEALKDGESPISNIVSEPEQGQLPGSIINNVPVDFNNPDFYVIDPNPYVPSVPDPDENGYTDSPEFIARNFEEADLIQQFTNGIVDGSGSTYLTFNEEAYLDGIFEVPVEAIRDALQYLGVNTNTLLEDIKQDMVTGKFDKPTPEPEAVEQELGDITTSPAANTIRELYAPEGLLRDVKPLMYLPADNSIAYKDSWDDLYVARPDGKVFPLNVSEDWLRDPKGAGQAGWKELTDAQIRKIIGAPEQDEAPAAPEPAPAPTPAGPTYPGPREPGYSPNNTTLVRGGAVVGKGSRVVATKDGKNGTVVAVQNDPEYVRIKFDDGTTAVRAASKVKALSNASGVAPTTVVVEPPSPAPGLERRLNVPRVPAPRIARSGETVGVNDDSTMPEWLKGLTNESAVQADFAAWGARDAEIAKAARERITFQNLEQEVAKALVAIKAGDALERKEAKARLGEIMGDIYGSRNGITFGGEFYSVTAKEVSAYTFDDNVSVEDIQNGKVGYSISTTLDVRDASGNRIGDIRRYLNVRKKLDENKNVTSVDTYVKNDYLAITGGGKKKGFATAFNRYSENWYIANGIEKVKVFAAGGANYQGGFVWALNGFGWDADFSATGVAIREFERQVKNTQEEAQVAYLKEKVAKAKKADGSYDIDILPTPLEYALVGWYPGAKDWLGKKVMITNGWNGVKHLKPDAKEQVQAANYAQIKNAERRIESKQNVPSLSSDALAVAASDAFRNNSNVSPYFSEITDVLKNNRSLAALPPAAKNALNAYISEQLLDKNRKMPLDDMFKLRTMIENEYRADYGYSDPFNSAEILSEFTTRDFESASSVVRGGDNHPIKQAGFTVRKLGVAEGGVNSTFEVTHDASGQVFYVKNEEFAARFTEVPGGVTELEAVTILRAAGMQGIHDVRIGKNDENLVVMSRTGSAIPLVMEAVTGSQASRHGLKDPNGNLDDSAGEPRDFIKKLNNPEDIVRMSIFDMLGNNQDRHNGNWMAAFDKATGKIRIFPVDNTIGVLDVESEKENQAMLEFLEEGGFNEARVYDNNMPQLIGALGTDNMLKLYKHEIDKIVNNLNDPLYQPRGFEMDAIISKWGSYDAFKDKISARLKKLTTVGTEEYNALKGALRLGYWG